jgi:hypothetical protein
MNHRATAGRLATACLALLLSACTGTSAPSESYDGLVLVPDSEFGVVYTRPEVNLAGYGAYGLEHCSVAFRNNWLRDQNNSRVNLGSRVTQKDVDRIKDALSAACDKSFRQALEQAPPYHLVDSFDGGESVLVLRPSIINLDINAPDVFTPGMTRTYTTDAGEMTLVLEGLDGTTGEILFRVVDRQRSLDTSRLQWSNSVTNQAEANRTLKRWASQLRKGLDRVTDPANNSI